MRESWAGSLNLIGGLGLTMVLSILLPLLAGRYIDAHYGTNPWATLILTLLGIAAGSFGVYRLVATSIEQATGARRSGGNDDHESSL